MKYLEVKFCITDNQGRNIDDEMLLQAAKDILCDFAGNAGFESFEDVMSLHDALPIFVKTFI